MWNFVANTNLPLIIELGKDWQGARVLHQGRNGCGVRAVCCEWGPRLLGAGRGHNQSSPLSQESDCRAHFPHVG